MFEKQFRGQMSNIELYSHECQIRGFHIYRNVWEPKIGDIVQCRLEPENKRDPFAVAVVNKDLVVGHLPREHSRVCHYFMVRGGFIHCTITGKYRNKGNGLKIPADLIFMGESDVLKLQYLLSKYTVLSGVNIHIVIIISETHCFHNPDPNRQHLLNL